MKFKNFVIFFASLCLMVFVFASPASAQIADAIEDLADDGIYSEQTMTAEIDLASQNLAADNVAFAWLASGDFNSISAISTQLLDGLEARDSKYQTIVVLSPDSFVIESLTLTESEIDTLFEASEDSFATGQTANALLQVANALPNSLASSSGLDSTTSGLSPDSSTSTDSTLSTDTTGSTTTENSADSDSDGGFPIFTILIIGVVLFLGYKFLKSRMKKKANSTSGQSGPFGSSPAGSSNRTGSTGGINIPGASRSGGAMSGGLGGILGSVLGRLGSKRSSSIGSTQSDTSSSPVSNPIPEGGNIFTGRSRKRTRSKRGRSFRSQRSTRRSKRGRNF